MRLMNNHHIYTRTNTFHLDERSVYWLKLYFSKDIDTLTQQVNIFETQKYTCSQTKRINASPIVIDRVRTKQKCLWQKGIIHGYRCYCYNDLCKFFQRHKRAHLELTTYFSDRQTIKDYTHTHIHTFTAHIYTYWTGWDEKKRKIRIEKKNILSTNHEPL